MMLSIKNLDRICLFTVFLIAMLCGILAVNVVAKKRNRLKLKNDLFSKQVMSLKLTEAKLESLKDTMETTRKRIVGLNDKIPASPEMGKFFGDIDTMTKKRDLTLMSIQPQSSKSEKSLTKIPVKMALKGKFGNIHKMLQGIESIDRMVVMERMKITREAEGKECRIDMLANIFKR